MKLTQTSITNILGEQFGPYKLVSRLGVGGMAETFVAIRSGPGGFTQRVCLKLVLPFFREDEGFARLFEREAKLAAKLRHRNIVGVIDFGQIDGTAYMALELVDGVDLRKLLDAQQGRRLAPEFVALLGLELAEALEHAHMRLEGSGTQIEVSDAPGIVHRDISPSNVLLSRRGEVFLTDFGVAKAISGGSRKQSAVKGKVPYMAPEYLRAEELDGRSDLFALGVVLFEALAGERPYEGAHDPATILQILKGEHVSLATLAPDAPPGLCRVIDSLIDPDPHNRPPDAAALIEELDQFATSRTSHRRLGRMVAELHDTSEPLAAESARRAGRSKTDVLPESPSGTGIGGSAEPRPAPWAFVDQPKTESLESAAPVGRRETGLEVPGSPDLLQRPAPEKESKPARPTPPAGISPPIDGQPIALVRPPERRGLKAGELDSGREWPWEQTSFAARSESERDPSRRKRLVIAFAVLVGLAGLTTSVIAFRPDSEPTADAPQSPEHVLRPGEKTKPEPPAPERDQGAAPSPPSGMESDDRKRAETSRTAVPATTEAAPQPEPVVGSPPHPARPKPSTGSSSESRSAREVRARERAITERQQRAAAKPATLTIRVIPFGNIWIGGEPWGSAPLKNEPLKPGTYRISAGRGKPEISRTIELKAGERSVVEFDLTQ